MIPEAQEVKNQLERLNQSKRRLRNLQSELLAWRDLNSALKSSNMDEVVSGGQTIPYAERRLLKIEQLEKLIEKSIDETLDLEDTFLAQIVQLDPISQNLLMERYMTGKPLKTIIREFNYSERHIYRLYNQAYEKMHKSKNRQ